ncbi:MAG TPA: hypothetical protein CFH79_03235 [Sulfurospirillum sp. UBA11407]|nr:MAG TPA: hypothetical protein CFH79_03235 [Sulfurospirillum sp. UBA11407]
MYIDGDILELDIDMDLEEVKALRDFVKDRLEYIEEIKFVNEKEASPLSSALFQLLYCVKLSKPAIKMDFFDKPPYELKNYGTMYWIFHE